jgi:hypothetical protein
MRTLRPMRKRTITAASAVVAIGMSLFGGGMPADASVTAGNPVVVYDATTSPLPPNIASLGYEATSTTEFGDYVHLAGTTRVLNTVTVTMSDWALYADYSSDSRYLGNAVSWTHPVTVNVYSIHLDTNGVPDTLLATKTEDVSIPWRPVADSTCATPTAWRAGNGLCYNGKAFNAAFDLSSTGVTLPADVIVGIAFNTGDYGTPAIGSAGPYNSLNVGVETSKTPTVGTDDNADNVFLNSSWAGAYADNDTAGTGTFRLDTGWTPNGTVSMQITASAGGCSVSESGDTITLLTDCTTDQTILVPDGKTLEGSGHSITAVDPAGGHFVGAVVRNAGASANVNNLTVSASNLSTSCDAGLAGLAGIRLDGAAGSITNNIVTGLQQGVRGDGCQEGDAIEVRNTNLTGTPAVTVTDNTVSKYQKTGILVTGQVSAVVSRNTVTGYGPVEFIAQNGVQISRGATARFGSNTIKNNYYSPKSYTACGLIIYKAGGVLVEKTNTYSGNEKDVCTYGKGGTYSPN